METVYRFTFGKKREIDTRHGRRVLVTPRGGGAKCMLRPDEYALARLFDGARGIEEVLDAASQRLDVRISREALEAFIGPLVQAGLLSPPVSEGAALALPQADDETADARPPESGGALLLAAREAESPDAGARPRGAASGPTLWVPLVDAGAGAGDGLVFEARPQRITRGRGSGAWGPTGGGDRGPPERRSAGFATTDGKVIHLSLEHAVEDATWVEVGAGPERGRHGPRRQEAPEQWPPDADHDPFDDEMLEDDDAAATDAALRPAHAHAHGQDALPAQSRRARDGGDRGAGAAGRRGRQGLRLLLPLPVRPLLPLGSLFALPARHWTLLVLLLLAFGGAAYGLWLNRLEVLRDLDRFFRPLTLVQVMLAGMLTVNLIGQLGRAATFRRLSGQVPRFGIALLFSLIPRFQADIPARGWSRAQGARLALPAAVLVTNLSLLTLGMAGWLVTKNAPSHLPLLFLALTALAGLRLLLSLNPLSRRPGYYLLAHKLGVPDLRARAFASLRGKSLPERRRGRAAPSRSVSPWVLRLYGVLALVYLVAIAVLATVFVGGWLEHRWGGTGVVIFLVLVALFMLDPVNKRAGGGASQGRTRLPVPAPRRAVTPRQRQERLAARRRWLLLLLLAVSLVWLGLQPYRYEPGGAFTLLPAQRSDVRSLISGPIVEILVDEGDRVERGEVLARLSSDEELKNIAITESKLRELAAKLEMAQNGATQETIDLAQQKVKTAQTRADFSQARVERLGGLVGKGHISRQEYEDALAQAEVDREQLEVARKELAKVQSGTRSEEIDAIEAEISKEASQLAYYQRQLEYSSLAAPIAGRIVSGTLLFAVGDYLKRGDLLATIENADVMLAEIAIPEADIGEVRIGAEVRIKAWSYPEREFFGAVQRIAPNAEDGDYGKIVRVRVEIDNDAGLLKSNMTGHAKIAGREAPAYLVFSRMLQRFFQVELWSWIP